MNGIAGAVASRAWKPTLTTAAVEFAKYHNQHGGNALAAVIEWICIEDDAVLDNPAFVANGHDGDSPKTKKYFLAQKAARVATIGARAMLDIGGYGSGLQAGSSALAWHRINALYSKLVPPSRQGKAAKYSGWFGRGDITHKAVDKGSLEIRMTQIIRAKMYSAAGSATRSALAFGTAGMSEWVGLAVGIGADSVADDFNNAFGQGTLELAMGLHWFAFLEDTVGRQRGVGPSLRILEEIWKEFCIAKTVSGVTVRELVREPRGYLAFADMMK